MPRGVYPRKKKTEAAAAPAAPATKGKRGRKPAAETVTAKKAEAAEPVKIEFKTVVDHASLTNSFNTLGVMLSTLTELRGRIENNPELQKQVDTEIGEIVEVLADFRKQLFGKPAPAVEEAHEEEQETAPAPAVAPSQPVTALPQPTSPFPTPAPVLPQGQFVPPVPPQL